eukprot:CAMPEP_0170502314 /NCGR_PEP_ID=MMETSP0208-20121228/41137_1 /TAXON_ID=197538 /ORGANISM="Strombidium inclinatum, Strain S3" /LENGTH=127 /DNA_ID=CAMNT_0010781321 /DNA_START=427 /DNA_END=810 /DNA_ORIENTATION=+
MKPILSPGRKNIPCLLRRVIDLPSFALALLPLGDDAPLQIFEDGAGVSRDLLLVAFLQRAFHRVRRGIVFLFGRTAGVPAVDVDQILTRMGDLKLDLLAHEGVAHQDFDVPQGTDHFDDVELCLDAV